MNINNLLILSSLYLAPAASLQFVEMKEETKDGISYIHLSLDPKKASFGVVNKQQLKQSQRANNTIIVNGGFFEQNLRPSGLLVAGGKTLAPATNHPLLSGIFFVKNGKAYISQMKRFLPDKQNNFALQSGPLVVEPGGKKGILANSKTKAERTVIVLDKSGMTHILVFKTKISLFECQLFIHKQIKNIDSALNFDGGPSSFIFVKKPNSGTTFGDPSAPYFIKIQPK